jgi:uncharacterized membrane protein YeaQ/YmgE (transglycosylase-associated protein family)
MLGCKREAWCGKLDAGAAAYNTIGRPDMGVIGTIIVGFIVGLLARYFFPGAVPLGFWLTVALGVGGSIVGGVVGSLIFRTPDGKFHPAGWILSILGAMAIIWVYKNYFMS